MVNLLNAVNFFGQIIDWNSRTTAIWLIVIQAIIAVIAITLIVYLILHRWSKSHSQEVVAMAVAQPTTQTEVIYVPEPKHEEERELTGISLDLGVVQREFTAGDKFSCDGLIINAEYNVSPLTESLVDYTLIEEETYERLTKKDKAHGVYVIKPSLYIVGKKVVTVKYGGQTAAYTISVNEPEVVAEEKPEPIVQVIEPIVDKTRELMYISLNTDNVQKEYTVGDSLDHDGLVVLAHFNIEPLDEEVSDYAVLPPDMSKKGKPTVTITYQGKTVGYQIVVNPAPEEPAKEEPQEVVVEQPTVIVQRADPIILEEESISSKLRYDKSFTARLIQSEDEIKYLYTDLKNELISFKSVHARISWKRETFKCHKDVVAKFAYRGKQLCIFLPLNPADYMDDNNHPVEDASDMSCYEDTPLMIRLKSKRRVKFAKQLINTVMEKFGIPRVEHESIDFYLPYEGILELINKGLIKREIKSPDDEKIFDENAQAASNATEDDTFGLTEVAPGIYVTKKD